MSTGKAITGNDCVPNGTLGLWSKVVHYLVNRVGFWTLTYLGYSLGAPEFVLN